MSLLKKLTISIVSHKHGKMLENLLSDLDRFGALDLCNVVITLNVSDPLFSIEQWQSKNIKWILNEYPKGFGVNHNHALTDVSTDWVLILNPDIRFPRDNLVRLLSDHADFSDIGIIAPRIVSSLGVVEDSVRSLPIPTKIFSRFIRRIFAHKIQQINFLEVQADWFAGMFLLMPSKVFWAVSGFDKKYFLYCEDCDLCIRVSLLGKRLLLNERYFVVHDAQRSSHGNIKYFMWHIRSLILLWTSKSWWIYFFLRVTKKINGVERNNML